MVACNEIDVVSNEVDLRKALSKLTNNRHSGYSIGSGEVKWTREENLTPLPSEKVIVGGRNYTKDKVISGNYTNL